MPIIFDGLIENKTLLVSAIIEVKDLSKSFIISHEGKERYTALRDVMAQKTKKLFSFPTKLKMADGSSREEFWALKELNFEIQQGDRVGIIGRNGAGKSTLLKILSRITEPTKGQIKIKGRVASLLEVGTGFHPELTGRENIFLNGAILGMSRAEIKKKFDEIVDFAEVERFLDTPVKRYSSGMYVRLAFAVAAHLEPEILIVDEVLAVGDAQFQKKCLGKMEDVSKNLGRTVIFVSHNIGVIKKLCNSGIYLKRGEMQFAGSLEKAIIKYGEESLGLTQICDGHYDFSDHPFRAGINCIVSAQLFCNGVRSSEVIPGSDVSILVTIRKQSAFINPEFGIVIKNAEMDPLLGLNNNHLGKQFKSISSNEVEVIFSMPKFKIYGQGKYIVNLYFGDEDIPYETFYDAFSFEVAEYDIYGSGLYPDPFWNKLCDDSFEIKINRND